jgi:1,2-diacylglycerol 3-beta-galactosyltransferase
MRQNDVSTAAKGRGVKKPKAKPFSFLSAQRFDSIPVTRPASPTGLPRVTILMTDAGGGHRSAARSLAEALNGQAHVTILNLVDDYAPFPFNQLSPTYGPFVNRAPWLYRLVYKATEDRKFVIAAENACFPLVQKRISAPLLALAPDLVISVHPLLTDLPIRLLRKAGSRAPFVTVVTDPVSVHPAWFCPEADLCVVATDTAYRSALEAGMDPARLRVIGLPIRRAFSEMRDQPRSDVRARLGLQPDWPLVLLSGSAAGVGKVLPMARTIARRLAEAPFPTQMAIIAGRNEVLLRQLRTEPWPIKVVPLGFVEQMADWMRAADILVTKAGPGTLAEAVCVGTPVIVTDFIPGQESGNVAWIERTGAGAFIREPERVAETIRRWLQPGNPLLIELSARARAAGRPEAATEIALAALALCQLRSSEQAGAL